MLFVGAASAAMCQEIPIDIIDRVNAVDYIFEGKVIKSTPYKTANGKYIHTSNTIEITKILKGDLTCGTIELITDGGKVDDLWLDISHNLDLRKDCAGIFLAKGTAKELSAVDFYEESNYQKIEATFEDQSFIKYWHDGVNWRVSDMWANFDSLAQVYNLAELITGLNFVDCDAPTIFGGGWEREAHGRRSEPVALRTELDSIRQHMALIAVERLQMRSEARANAMGTVTYTMSNVQVTGTDPSYLEFDINMYDDMGTNYLRSAGVRIVYDPAVFGTNISQGVNVIVENGSLVSDLSCYYNTYPFDLGSTSLMAYAEAIPGASCMALVPNNPTQLFHVRLQMLDCPASEITLQDSAYFDVAPSAVLLYTTYADSPDAQDYNEYATASIDQTETVPGCGPAITSFSPTTVAGGIQQILEIHGHGFGETRGTGTVFFKNAADGGASEVPCNANDFLAVAGWSDELIRLYMPSSDTSILVTTTDTTATPNCPAGSGPFRVVTDEGISLSSPGEITVSYSVTSDPSYFPKRPIHLGPLEAFGGTYTFHLDSLVADFEDGALIPVIRKALREWTCLTGINWSMAEGTEYPPLPGAEYDSLCVIRFGPLPPTQLAVARNIRFGCSERSYVAEADLVINDSSGLLWFIDTIPENAVPAGYNDLYQTILHELGHAHSMQHVIEPERIMYFAETPSDLPRNIELFADGGLHEGGNWVMEESVLHPPPIGCGVTSISTTTSPLCSGFYSIDELVLEAPIRLHPNPIDHELSITSIHKRMTHIEISNPLGALVHRSGHPPTKALDLDLALLKCGPYMLRVIFNDGTTAVERFIKAN